jgi:hypothetical protein
MAAATATRRLDADGVAVRGVGGAPVRTVLVGGMIAWVSDLDSTAATGADLRGDHAQVVAEALRSGVTPLPARRGQVFASEESLRTEITSRHESLIGAVARVSGMVEMTLHVQMLPGSGRPGASAPDASTQRGRAYLEQLRSRNAAEDESQAEGERMRAQARASLADLVHADALAVVRGARRYLVSHLVREAEVEAWRMRAESLAFEGSRIRVVGPLPPYSFATIDDIGSAAKRRD